MVFVFLFRMLIQLQCSTNKENNLKKPDGVKSKLMNVELSKKYGWKAEVSLDEGLKKTISWFIKSQN